jgi:hypothetical protein
MACACCASWISFHRRTATDFFTEFTFNSTKKGSIMPTINVQLFEGRTVEQKRAFVKAVTEVDRRHAGRQCRIGGHHHRRCQTRKLGYRRQTLV